ncbi:tetratricopeptide repeat protein [Luteolibacter flavescens]|uniref:Tetratricopeptide repeat protein n=1 Tax=Luteolibacter flavescens TaxID=1859460 RepID=A0ABT3FT09_9BACT|nr:tetratricopeptide repeat protein [Luteolibacter flavescens]MCW1886439.1 tetratricopeptide repeat protein [Luteolibacter flavescens]
MSDLLLRARLLRDSRRYPEAIAALHQHLALDPDSFLAHYELAVTRLIEGESYRKALEDVDRAVALSPENPSAHAIRSAILLSLDRDSDALAAADKAIGMDPEFAFAWVCRGKALLAKRQLPESEAAARRALELDADFSDASNLLSTVLRLQKRFGEAEVEIDRHLERDPENAWTFATAGWTALNRSQREKAENLFREALRLDPGMEHARLGLREAYKARSPFYRLFLKWVFFLNRHSEKNRWLIIIGIIVAFRFGRELLSMIHPLAAVPLVVAYLLLTFGSWLASGLGHFLLLKDSLARLSLNRQEKLDGLAVGGLFFGGLLLLVLGLTVLPAGIAFVGGAMIGASIPGSLIFDNPSVKGRIVFGLTTLTILGCGALICLHDFRRAVHEPLMNDATGKMLTVALVALAATTWIGGIPALRRGKVR